MNMNIYHAHGVLDWHADWTRVRHLEDAPDLHEILKDKVKDVLWELERADYDDPKAAENSVDDAIRLLKDFDKDVPDRAADYISQSTAIQGLVDDMGNAALSAFNEINLLEDYIRKSGTDTPVIHKILDRLADIQNQMNDVFTSQSTRLDAMQRAYHWIDREISITNKLFGTDRLYLDVLPEQSSTDHLVYGKGNWILYDGGESIDLYLPQRVHVNRYAISTFPNGGRCVHNWVELGQYFQDWANPTPNELALYKMGTEKVWDILDWHDILKAKTK